jgi:hypothetical protein
LPPSSHVIRIDAAWKFLYRSSEMLSWKDRRGGSAVNIVVIGKLGKDNLQSAFSDFNDPSYRLELVLDLVTAASLRGLLDSGPLKDLDDVNYPLVGRVAVFSTKVKNLLKLDAPGLDASDPFPFLFDGDNMDGGADTKLKVFPASELTTGVTTAVETNVSSYAIPARGNFPRTGYTMSLRHVYVLGSTALGSAAPLESPPRVSAQSRQTTGRPSCESTG